MKSMSYESTVHYRVCIGVIYIKCARNFFFEKKKTYSWVKSPYWNATSTRKLELVKLEGLKRR